MSEHVRYEVSDGIATITMNRPEVRNAVTMEMITELIGLFDVTDADDDVRAVVVTGAGSAFCAGADLSGGAGTFGGIDPTTHRDPGGMFTLRVFASLKPVIAAVNGHAVGFGASMTLPMDFRVVAEGARYGFVFAARGVVPEGASSWFLPHLVGLPRALDWTLTGRMVESEEALASGLAHQVVAADDVLPRAYEIAQSIARNIPPLSAAATRQLLWRNAGLDAPVAAHHKESYAFAALGGGADSREAVDAFLARRPAIWTQSVSKEFTATGLAPEPENP